MALNSSEWSNINSTKIIGYVAGATPREGLRACLISFQLLSPVQVVTDCDGVRMEGSRAENSSAVSALTSGNISDLIVDNWWLCQLCTVKGYHMSLWLLGIYQAGLTSSCQRTMELGPVVGTLEEG